MDLEINFCDDCQNLTFLHTNENQKLVHYCKLCENKTDFKYIEIPYSCKLMFQELQIMNVAPRIITD